MNPVDVDFETNKSVFGIFALHKVVSQIIVVFINSTSLTMMQSIILRPSSIHSFVASTKD